MNSTTHPTSREVMNAVNKAFADLRTINMNLRDDIQKAIATPVEHVPTLSASLFDYHREETLNTLERVRHYSLMLMDVLAKEREGLRKQANERAQAEADEQALIHRMTGEAITRDDLPFRLCEVFRENGDVTPYVAAMSKLDELDMAHAGVTSWCDRDEDEVV